MAGKRSRKAHSNEEVTLNMTAMLDMAFQLLAFLILTFRPQAAEGAIGLRLPATLPITKGASTEMTKLEEPELLEPEAETLTVSVHSTVDGRLESIDFGKGVSIRDLNQFKTELQSLFGEPGTPLGQIFLNIDPALHYQYVIQVIDVCAAIKLADGKTMTKVGFAELSP